MGKLWEMLDGYKCYLVALGAVGYAVYMGVTGQLAWTDAQCAAEGCKTVVDFLLGGGALAAVKSAMTKVGM